MKLALDLILLLIVLSCVWIGYKRGLIMGIGGMIVVIVSLYAATLLSTAFSYEAVPALRPFADGYVEKHMKTTVLKKLELADTQLSYEDVLTNDPTLRHAFCYESYKILGIHSSAAEQMAKEAEKYADDNKTDITSSVVEILCKRIAYIAGITLFFCIILIGLTALGNLTNLSFRLPNMERLDYWGGAFMGLVLGVTYCVLICWLLRFLGLLIGPDTLQNSILGRFFIAINFLTKGIGI